MRIHLLSLVVLLVATSVFSSETVAIPSVPLADVPQEGRQQFEVLEAEIARLSAEGGDPIGLSEAYGEFGKLSYLYDFLDSAEAAWKNASALHRSAFRWHYYLGVLYRLRGEMSLAAERLESALELKRDDLATLIRLGRVRFDEGRMAEAGVLFEEALRQAPGSAAALYGLGRIAVAEGRYQEALGLLEQVAGDQPAGSAVHHQLGLAYRGLGELERARDHLSRSEGIRVMFSDPLMEQLAGMSQGAHGLVRAGLQAQRSGNLGQALRILEEAVSLDPENAWIHYNLGVVHQGAGNLQVAAGEYGRAVELDPQYRDAHFNLGQLLAEAGDYEGAVRHFGAAAEIDTEDRQARLELAVAVSRLGRSEEALAQLEELVQEAPSLFEARLMMATLLAQMGRDREALQAVDEGMALDASDDQWARLSALAGRVTERSDWELAETHYRRALELDPSSEEALLGLAMLLGRGQRFGEAGVAFDRLVSAHPENADYRMGQGMSRLLGADYGAAATALGAAYEEFPGRDDIALLLARLLATCPDEAVRDGERALQLALGPPDAQRTLERAETLAMALAELGRFEEAIGVQRQVVAQLGQGGARAELSRGYLTSYEAGRPVRAPWSRDVSGGGSSR